MFNEMRTYEGLIRTSRYTTCALELQVKKYIKIYI